MTVYIVVGYLAGAALAPFFWSLIEGYPFMKPRLDSLDATALFVVSVFWPVVLAVWLVALWACVSSSAGSALHETIAKWLEGRAG